MTVRLICCFVSMTLLAACNSNELAQKMPSTVVPDSQKDHVLKENMRRVQLAAEHFAASHGSNQYPVEIDDEFKSYFPGGVEGKTPAPVGLANAYTGTNEFPVLGTFDNVSELRHGRRVTIDAGKIIYSPIGQGKGYAIVGGAGDGLSLFDENKSSENLVFSNFD